VRGRTPPACGHPLSEGDDLTPALSSRRGRRTPPDPLSEGEACRMRGMGLIGLI